MFDEGFYQRHRGFVDSASAIISLYGDEATEPSLRFAASLGKPCALIPCNECFRFFPSHNRTYDGYVQARWASRTLFLGLVSTSRTVLV